MLEQRIVQAEHKGMLVEITSSVQEIVAASGVRSGVAVVSTPDVDAGVLITSFYDPKGHEDIIDDFVRIWPARDNVHFEGAVSEGAAHSKSSIAGQSVDLIVEDGELKLGGSQGIFFAEYTEPRARESSVAVFGA